MIPRNDSNVSLAEPAARAHASDAQQLALLEASVARLNDIVLITEADPLDEPGPRIVFVNDAFERLTGYRRDEVLGKSPRLLQGPLTDRAALDRIRDALEAGQPVRSELVNYTKQGKPFWLELDIAPILDGDGRMTHCVAVERDISERKDAELALARVHRGQRVRTACNEALVRATDETALLRDLCRIAVETGGYRTAWVGFEQHDLFQPMRSVAWAGAGASEPGDIACSVFSGLAPNGPLGRAFRGHEVVVVGDLESDPEFKPWVEDMRRLGYRGLTVLPLHHADSHGVFALFVEESVQTGADERRLLQELANDLASGIATLRTRREQAQIQDAVLKIAAGVSVSSGTAFFEELVVNMTAALGADAGFISRFQPGNEACARTEVAYLEGQLIPNFEYPLNGTPCEHLARARSYVIPEHVSTSFACTAALTSNRAEAYVGQRLENAAGEPIGQVFVLFNRPLKETALIQSTLQIFATRVASELERQTADAHILRQASLLDKAQDAIMVRGLDNHIRYWNKGAERLYGWSREEVSRQSIETLLYADPTAFRENTQRVLEHGEWSGEIMQQHKDGSALTVEVHWTLLRDEQGAPDAILAINTDITERKEAERAIQQLAFYDPLTGLPNRQLLRDRLQHALCLDERNRQIGALLFIDVDNFKTLNDTLGHAIGDLLLQQIAARLQGALRRGDTLARLGGDEFVIVLENLSTDAEDAARLATAVGEKVLSGFAAPFHLADYVHHCTSSIGVTLFNDHTASLDELLKRADLAMYQAKAHGRNALRFFDPVMQAVVAARAELETELRQALRHQAFELHFQAQVDGHGHAVGAEALLRWRHPERGWIPPASFVPLAEETGIILPLGQWVLEAACTRLATWAALPHTAGLTLAVNVSARQFRQPDFVEQVLAVVDRTGAPPSRLKLELTESLLVHSLDETRIKMNALKARGIGFSLDDFGTGYSSLAYLKRLPLDEIKIDRTFVHDLEADSNHASIARSILALGHSLALEVVAEGVETGAQHAFLAQHGCRTYQGFLFHRPQPADAFEDWVKRQFANSSPAARPQRANS